MILNEINNYCLFDQETSNLNLLTYNMPWEISFLIVEDNKIVKEYQAYIKWDNFRISDGAREKTRFNDELYKEKAIDPQTPLEEFEKYLYDSKYFILGANILGFDVYIHNIWRKLLGKKTDYSYINRCIDTNCLAKALKLGIFDLPNAFSDLLAFQYRMQAKKVKGLKTNLEALGKEFGIQYDYNSLHQALSDVNLNKSVFDELKKRFNNRGIKLN